MKCRRIALSFFLLCSCLALAQYRTGAPKPEPALIAVREFCRLDFLGGRLSPEGWARMKSLTSWKENPAWRQFRVGSRYEQTGETNGYHNARIAMQYQVLGDFELGVGFTPAPASQSIDFKLKENDDQWRIESTDPELFIPHVSKTRAIQWLTEKQKTVTDPGEKISIESALKQLRPVAP